MNPRVKAALLFGLGAAFLIAMVAYVGPGTIIRAVTTASPLFLGLAVLSYAGFFAVRGLRWKLLFSQSAPDVRVSSATGITAVGWLANSVLPLKGGEVLRAALMSKREKVGLATSASTVALERVLDLLGLALVAAAGLRLLPRAAALPASFERAMTIVWVLPLVALAILAILVRFREPTMRVARKTMRPLGRVGKKLAHFLDTVLAGLHALAQHPRLLMKLLPLTIVVAILQALVFTFLAIAFMPGIAPAAAFAGAAVFLLSFVVSITPGNVGTYEAAFVAVYVGLGVAPTIAIPAAVLTHVLTTLIVALLGGIGMAALGLDKTTAAWRPARTPQGGMP